MARITVEDCLNKETNRFALVLLAAKRAKQLLKGAHPLISETKNKPVVTALREIAAGQVRYMNDEDRKRADEKERQAQQAREAAVATQQTTIISSSTSEFTSVNTEGQSTETSVVRTVEDDDEVKIESVSVEVVGPGRTD